MSIINEAIAPCTKCGQQHKITVYRSINTSENPELKAKVSDGSLFLWECPHCGQVNLAKYETLYHDPAGKLMVWLIPSGEISETQMQAITMHTKAMGGYTLRRVNDMGNLMEKVLIADAGLNDIVLEMCKYVTKLEMLQKSVCAEREASAVLDHDATLRKIGSEELLHHTEGAIRGYHDSVGKRLGKGGDIRGMVGLHMQHHEIIGRTVAQLSAQVGKPFLAKARVDGIHHGDLLVHNRIRIICHSVRDGILSLKKIDLVIIDANVFNVFCNEHTVFPFQRK